MQVRVWDQFSPINGVSAAFIRMTRDDLTKEGVQVLIVEDDWVLVFQTVNPKTGKPIMPEHAERIGADLLRKLYGVPG